MSLKLVLLATLLASIIRPAVTQGSDDYSACVEDCFAKNAISSFCNGDETGTALDDCTCNTWLVSGGPGITCIQQCPPAEQVPFAESLPAKCRTQLFPNLDLSSATSTSSVVTSATATSTEGAAASATESLDAASGPGVPIMGPVVGIVLAALVF